MHAYLARSTWRYASKDGFNAYIHDASNQLMDHSTSSAGSDLEGSSNSVKKRREVREEKAP
ncbi:hypothetical protein E2C01_013533 [Portunus trituberculatus]|uniref:Uncharacterized protein n=1 Tax=Portunus trituberculatus TaxID=210409 RepID=A0A5B7DGW2_PORTR|nr:hypothetical protein [Portunus trituberculatus]